jgi:hypothetical protein
MTSQAKKREEKAFNELVEGVQALYPERLPQAEAEEAARNLAKFFKLLVKAKQEQLRKEQNQPKNEEGSP